MPLILREQKPEKQLQHRTGLNSSRKQREKTARQRPGERKRRRRERDGASGPFVRILSERVRGWRGRPPKDPVRLVHLADSGYVRQVESWLATERPKRREPLWSATDETMRNWLKAAVRRANDGGVFFSIPVIPHTFRHSWVMHLLYHRQPLKVIQALAGHKDARSIEVYTRVFALDVAATLAVSFSGEGAEAAAVLRSLPPA